MYFTSFPLLTTTILLIVMEHPSHSNLNCLIVVLRNLGRIGDEFRFHSGLSTSVEWGKPLSIFLLQRTFFLLCGGESTITFSHPRLFYKCKNFISIGQTFCKIFFISLLRIFYQIFLTFQHSLFCNQFLSKNH